VYTIELSHPTDPRWLLVDELPDRVTADDLASSRYGKLLLSPPGRTSSTWPRVDAVYKQSDGPGADWVHPG
jgi:hypothetical protein